MLMMVDNLGVGAQKRNSPKMSTLRYFLLSVQFLEVSGKE